MRMNDAVQAKLREIVARYGAAVIDDPIRCQGLLNDLCPTSRREVASLILVLKEGVPHDLLKAGKNAPLQAVSARLVRQVVDHIGLSEEVARWAVESWERAVRALPPGAQLRRIVPAATPAAPPTPGSQPRRPRPLKPQRPPGGGVTSRAKPAVDPKLRSTSISDTVQHPLVLIPLAVLFISGLYLIVLQTQAGWRVLSIVLVIASGLVVIGAASVLYPRIRERNARATVAPPAAAPPARPPKPNP